MSGGRPEPTKKAHKRLRVLWRRIVEKTPYASQEDQEILGETLYADAIQSYFDRGSNTGHITVKDVNTAWSALQPVILTLDSMTRQIVGVPRLA